MSSEHSHTPFALLLCVSPSFCVRNRKKKRKFSRKWGTATREAATHTEKKSMRWMKGTRTNIYHRNIVFAWAVCERVYCLPLRFGWILLLLKSNEEIFASTIFFLSLLPLRQRFFLSTMSVCDFVSHSLFSFAWKFRQFISCLPPRYVFVFTIFVWAAVAAVHCLAIQLQYIYLLCSMGWIIARHSFRFALRHYNNFLCIYPGYSLSLTLLRRYNLCSRLGHWDSFFFAFNI